MGLKDITTLEPNRKYYILFDLYATLKNIPLPWGLVYSEFISEL